MASKKETQQKKEGTDHTPASNTNSTGAAPVVEASSSTGAAPVVEASSSTAENKVEPASTSTPTPTPQTSGKKIEVEEDVLKNILNELNSLKEKTSQYEQTASQDQIRKIEALRASGKLVKQVKLRRFEGKLVVGWKMTKDNVWVADGRLHEIQEMDVFLEDDTKVATTLLQFTRNVSYEPYEVIKESKTATGEIEYTVETEGGKELVVKGTFVN